MQCEEMWSIWLSASLSAARSARSFPLWWEISSIPALSLLTGRISLSNLSAVIPASISGTEPIVIAYGAFLQTVLDFLIIALSIFLAIRLINKFKRKHEEETPPAPPTPSNEEILLTEIRDLLKEKNN